MYKEHSDLSLILTTPLGPNILIIDRLRMTETISEPFVMELDMHSVKHDISFDDIIGQEIKIEFKYNSETRYFSGIVGEFAQGFSINTKEAGNKIELTRYTAKVYPRFWLLKFSQDHQIFQQKSAIGIINSVLVDNGVKNKVDATTSCGQTTREYCVQYRESYFDFASRLMEEEGIFYFFEHSSRGEKIILCDDSSSALTAYHKLPMTPASVKEPYFDQIQTLTYARHIVSRKFQMADYNFETASTKLFSNAEGAGKGLTVYRFPGYYNENRVGEKLATNRIQELEWRKEMISGISTAPLLTPMQSFKVSDHPRDSFNSGFLVYSVTHEINMLAQPGEQIYTNKFEAFPLTIPFRAPVITPKPTIASTQTARVTGKSGEEIWCDEYGRIKVKFHWDQKGSTDEKSSCWIRVAQLWASSGWGGLWTPRVGMEVVITFLEGDPDRPLITGCVYNSDNLPPYAKDEPTKSTIKSNTTKGGNGFNEIRLEDKKGGEEIFIHAQKDMNTVVEDNRTLRINDEDDTTDIMCGDRKVILHANDGSKKKNAGNDTLVLIKGNRLIDLKGAGPGQGNQTLKIAKGDNAIEITKGNMNTTLSDGNYELAVTGNLTISVSGSISITSGGEIKLESGGDFKVTAGGNIQLTSASQTKLNSAGPTQIQGSVVQIN